VAFPGLLNQGIFAIPSFDHVVQSDGLDSYAAVAKSGASSHVGYHVHARRKFADIVKVQGNHRLASEMIELYAVFFGHEKQLIEQQRGAHPLGDEGVSDPKGGG